MPSYSTDPDNIVRYVLGDMAIHEQIAFEVRMAGDQELAQAVVTAIAIDELLRRTEELDRRGRSLAGDPSRSRYRRTSRCPRATAGSATARTAASRGRGGLLLRT